MGKTNQQLSKEKKKLEKKIMAQKAKVNLKKKLMAQEAKANSYKLKCLMLISVPTTLQVITKSYRISKVIPKS
ncbi:hypothetical protein RHGRI_013952 [Rhododendron griersonianum]|uniref:Uncharacterized protein n=1 Tax=Rhododendron griersonianum TaxID=479676 RepID=A0AAV6K7I0_9ERIC|nr:hypothetical protein RHGRI_013952 [Rhododendron griersonianum]